MRRVDRVNLAAGAVLAGSGAAYLFLAQEYPTGTPDSPGPGMLPFLVGVGEVLAGVAICVMALFAVTGGTVVGREAEASKPDASIAARVIARREAALAAMMVGYALLLPVLGFMPATFALVAGFTALGGTTRWSVTIAVAAVLSVGLYALFTALGVKFPHGVLGVAAGIFPRT